MRFSVQKRFKWAIEAPTTQQMESYVGRFVRVKDDDGNDVVVEIEKIVGNIVKVTKFEIISKGKHYLISMLDFFAQINGEYVSPEEIALFDETSFNVANGRKRTWNKTNGIFQR